MRSYTIAGMAFLASPVLGGTHNMFVGNLNDPFTIHALSFNDQTMDLKVTETIQAHSSYAWITFNVPILNLTHAFHLRRGYS
jgi:hypothetical protein